MLYKTLFGRPTDSDNSRDQEGDKVGFKHLLSCLNFKIKHLPKICVSRTYWWCPSSKLQCF